MIRCSRPPHGGARRRRARLDGNETTRGSRGANTDEAHDPTPLIRTARVGDADAVRRLLAQLGYERSDDGLRRDLASALPEMEAIVAEADGRVVGLLALAVRHEFHRDGPIGVIDALVVDASARSGGIGAALLEAALQRATEHGCSRVELHSNRRRRRARRFYERHGFTVTSNYFVRHVQRPSQAEDGAADE